MTATKAVPYAVCCKSCGHVVKNAWDAEKGIQTDTPLSPRGHAPVYCQKCGNRNWQVPATADQITAFESKQERESRRIELARKASAAGLLKLPDGWRGPSHEVESAVANILEPLEGEELERAVAAVKKIGGSRLQMDAGEWIDTYDAAVATAIRKSKT